jgi:hypothetical protein
MAGFFFRESGNLMKTDAPYFEFPFRRKDLGGGRPAVGAPQPRAPGLTLSDVVPSNSREQSYEREPAFEFDDAGYEATAAPEPREKDMLPAPALPGFAKQGPSIPVAEFRKRNIWIPLSFIFLLLGVVIGFQVALSYRSGKSAGLMSDPYGVSLSASRVGENLHVRWDRLCLPIRNAQRGVLTIQDGSYSTAVDLDVPQLQNPSVFYRHISSVVRFKLEVYLKDKNSVTETLEWRR